MQKPLVSISCTTFNHASFIRQCLDGILNQICDFSFEILIHDDASTDGTIDIIREYEEKYPHIVKAIIQKENQWSKGYRGLNAKYNYSRALGKYIALCEGDDYWIDPLKLKTQIHFLENNEEYSLCGHNALTIINGVRSHQPFSEMTEDQEIPISLIIDRWVLPTASLVFRLSYVKTMPDWVVKIYSGDLTLALLLAHFGKVFYFSKPMSIYRINRDSHTSASGTFGKDGKFVMSQHILLFEYFNQETEGRYNTLLTSKIKSLEKEIRFLRLREYNIGIALLVMPLTALRKAVKRIKTKFKNE